MDAHVLFDALDDGLAVVSEWDGGTIEEKLQAAGLDPDAVKTVIEERFEAFRASPDYNLNFDDPAVVQLFAAGVAEGLLAGTMFERQRRGT